MGAVFKLLTRSVYTLLGLWHHMREGRAVYAILRAAVSLLTI